MPHGAASERTSFIEKLTIVAVAAILVLLVFALRHVLLLVFASILIAVGLRGFAEALERIAPVGRKWSMAAAALIVVGTIVGIAWTLGAQITAQAMQLIETLPDAWSALRERLVENSFGAALVAEIESSISNAAGGPSPLPAFASRVGAFTVSFAGATLELLLVLVAAAFFAINPELYRRGALLLAPQDRRQKLRDAFAASARALRKWLLGTLASMAFLTIVLTLGLWALGVPAPLALGLLSGLAQFVPLVGPLLAAGPGILLALTQGPQTALWAALLYFAVSQIEANLVFPLIQQKAVSLPPALTLFAVIAAGLLLGPLGVLFATPLVVVISVFVTIFYVRGVLRDDVAVPGD